MPVAGAMRNQLLAGTYIQADETPVDVQTHDGSGANHQSYLWQYGTPEGMTVFDFRMSRKREGPLNFLGNFEGLLQTDGYAAYDRVGGPKMVHAACWAHARRYFVDAVKLNKQDAASIRAVELINDLFAIDAQARNEKMDDAARHVLRRDKAPPLLDEIRTHILEMSKTLLPSSAPGQACRYTLAIWKKLIRFLDYPELELSNNFAENSMRPIAVGRNYVQFSIMRSVLRRGRWMAGLIGAVSVQGTQTSHNQWSPDLGISDARRSSWKMEQQFIRRCAHGWSAAFFNPTSQSSVRIFSAAVTTHRPSTATYTALHTLRIGPADTGWRWSRWTSGQLLDLSLSTYRIVIARIP
jgi:hypothetical protein